LSRYLTSELELPGASASTASTVPTRKGFDAERQGTRKMYVFSVRTKKVEVN
jgi:hypothetical protein